jgi:hypothetical protein
MAAAAAHGCNFFWEAHLYKKKIGLIGYSTSTRSSISFIQNKNCLLKNIVKHKLICKAPIDSVPVWDSLCPHQDHQPVPVCPHQLRPRCRDPHQQTPLQYDNSHRTGTPPFKNQA